MIVAAADGSSLSNPGPAGWAWYIDDDQWARGGWPLGTNNKGELMAVLDLLNQTASSPEPLHVLCDSQYVINSVTKWMHGWKRRGWKKGDGKPVLNVELMQQLDVALRGRKVTFEWVKGHAGHPMNEAADSLARGAATAYQKGETPTSGPGFGGSSAAQPSESADTASAATSAPTPTPVEAPQDFPEQFSLFDDHPAGAAAGPVVRDDDRPGTDELVALYNSVGWTTYTSDPRTLTRAIEGSLRVVTARIDGKLVGLARVVGDGASIAYLQDILVDPAHQRTGLGRHLMQAALEPFGSVRQTVLLTDADPAQRAFYESLGFTELRDMPGEGLRGFVRFKG